MRHIISQLLCCAVVAMSLATTQHVTAQSQSRLLPVADTSSPSPCQDSIETVPGTDDLDPVLIAADISCTVPPTPISI
jgi:hypothetical protein